MEQQPANQDNLLAFKDGWDEYDFARLVEHDPAWSALYSEYESVEEYDASNFEADAIDLIYSSEFPEHVLGYAYYRELWSHWASKGALYYRLTPYRYKNPTAAVLEAVDKQIEPLVEQQFIEKKGSFITSGPKMPYNRFPTLTDDFEAFAHKFIAQCGGRASIRNITLEYFDKDKPTPYEFWAGHKAGFRLALEGAVEREYTVLVAKKTISLGVIAAKEALGGLMSQADIDVSRRIRQSLQGLGRMQKPRQRGRYGR